MKLNKEQIEFLHKYTYGGWTLNEKTGLVDIKGNFYCNYSIEGEGIFPQSEEKLTNFKGVKFGVVTGNFYCSNNSLTSLDGAPQEVRGAFFCDHNSLTSLEGAPQWVGEDFYCSNNSLTSLEGAPQWVGESFCCYNNTLTSLEGAPLEVGEDFYCSNNSLTSLEGAPQWVGESFCCYNNTLTSLVGAPLEVGEDFDCSNNSLTSLEGAPQVVGGIFHCENNNLTSLEGAPPWVGEDGEDFDCSINKYFYCSGNPISEETLDLVWETMQEKNVDYWFALSILKSEIKSEDWKLLEGELDERISKDSQKGISMMDRFGHFD